MIGQELSHFSITAKLGEGGMGVLYRAEDTKLGREVAIKVLPEAFVQDQERLARFEREAKVLASLNHSHERPPGTSSGTLRGLLAAHDPNPQKSDFLLRSSGVSAFPERLRFH